MKTKHGKSRRYAFIGYKSLEDAEHAVKYFNNSFIDTSKIHVELAKTFSDPTVPLSFKQKQRNARERLYEQEQRLLQQEQESGRRAKKQKTHTSSIDEEIENNPKLKEFMEVMKPSHQVKSWANDTIADGSGAPSAKDLEKALADQDSGITDLTGAEVDMVQVPENASDDEYEDFRPKQDDDEDEEEMMSLGALNKSENQKEDEEIAQEEDTLAKDTNVSDLEWLKSRRVRIKENGDEVEPNVEEQQQATNEAKSETKSAVSNPTPQPRPVELREEEQFENKIKQTGRLFIRNILYESTEKEFRQLFEPYGALEEVHIAVDTRTGKSKGFVYIQFKNSDDAFRAYKSLDKQIFQGRLLHILPGEKKKDHRLDEFDLKNLPLKKQRELKRKDQASKSQFSWNSLYMNTDAVLESVAAKLGVTKSQLIDPENSNSAVKQALAEAHVIGDVRTYFEQKGVDLTVFNKKERDDRVILVKNFPYGTTIEEIGDLFSQYGQLKRMLMPPAGTIAIVEFRDVPSARTAFSKLAYRRFKKSILYLEKGPVGLFTKEPTAEDIVEQKSEDSNAVEAKVNAHDIMGEGGRDDEDEDVVEGPTVSVFVKNLNFATKSGDLAEIFKGLPGFVIATVKTKPDPKKKDSVLSMGFGFVEFKTKQQAEVAISTMNGYVLEGHKLQLKLSHRQGSNNATKVEKSNKSNKIIIKNLPFEASRKDVFELFSAFGNLKSVRVPKKFDKSARGFAFVEFTLLKEAENAMNQLHGVHLLGRRLVMQYAEADAEDVEEEIAKMTKKVKKQVATQQLGAARLAGKGKIELEETQDDFADL